MLDAAVDDVRGVDAAGDRLHARRELRAHTAAEGVQPVLDLAVGRLADQRIRVGRVGEPADHVGEEDDLVGAESGRHRAGGLVGVDVVGVAVAVRPDRGDHGYVVGGHVRQHVDVDALDLTDEADVLAAGRGAAADAEQRAVVAAQPDGGLTVAGDAQHDLLVDLADQHHLRYLDGGGIGHAQPGDELDRHPQPPHVGGDVRAAAVDDDRVQPDVLEQHHVARELLAQALVLHRRAAVLDHDRLAVKLADVGQRLEQCGYVAHGGLQSRARRARRVAKGVSIMSCTPR